MNHKNLEQLSKECPTPGKWCFLRELVKHLPVNDRTAIQIRLIYDYKFLQSMKEGKDIGQERALNEFVEKHAKRYAELYSEGQDYESLRYKLFM